MDLGDFLSSINSKQQDVESLIVSFIDNEKNDKSINATCINKLLICFQLKQTNLHDFFLKMRYYFIQGRESTRRRATELVLELFTRYSGILAEIDEIQTLFAFFLTRVFDVVSIKPTIQVLLQILKNLTKNFPAIAAAATPASNEINDAKTSLITSLFATLNDARFSVSAYAQDVRDAVYCLLKFCQDNFAQICIDLKAQFIKTILESTEDEKDPRCIIKSFQLVHFILDKCPEAQTKPFIEEIFDNLECYYPIDFQHDAEQDKQYQITSTQLARSLDQCLISSLLLEKTLSLLHEKIHSSYLDAKIASMNTYTLIFRKHKPSMLTTKQRQQILADLLENAKDIEEEDLSEAVVNCIKEYVLFLHSTHGIDSNVLNFDLYEDLKQIEKHIFTLLEDGLLHHNAQLSEKIITAIAAVNDNARYLAVNWATRYFNSRFTNKDTTTASKMLEYVLVVMLAAEKQLKSSCSLSKTFAIDAVKESNLKSILISEIQVGSDETVKILCIAILSKLVLCGNKPQAQEIAFIDVCIDIGLTEIDVEEYSATVKKCLVEYAYLLASHLPNTAEHVAFLEIKLLSLIEQANMRDCVVNGFNSMVLANTAGWQQILKFVLDNLKNASKREFVELILTKIYNLNKTYVNEAVFTAALQIDGNDLDKPLSQLLKRIIARKEVSPAEAVEIVKRDSKTLTLFSKAVKVHLKSEDFKDSIFKSMTEVINSKQRVALVALAQTPFAFSLATYFGNHIPDQLTSEQVKVLCDDLASLILSESQQSLSAGKRDDIVLLTFCSRVLRGMLLRMDQHAFACLSQLIHSELKEGVELPLAFYNVIMASTDVRKKYLKYSPTVAQRLFLDRVYTFHAKIKEIKDRSSPLKNKCYHVLTSTLLGSPFAIIKENKQICLPILIEALTFSSESESLESAIKLLTRLLHEDLSIIGSSSECLIECLLKLLEPRADGKEFTMSCLIEIIKCLAQCINFDTHIIKRYKSTLLDVLDMYLAHSKRRVRKQTVYTVNQWHQVI